MNAPKISDSHTNASCEIPPMTPHSNLAQGHQKIDPFSQECAERQNYNKTLNTIKMNKQIKTKKTITCSTCGKTGHNKNNEKFHPDYKFTGVSVPTPVKSCCYRCDTSTKELFLGVDVETGFKTSYCRVCKEAVEIHNIDFNPDNWIGFTIPCDLCTLPHYVSTTVCRSVNGNFCDNIGCYYTQKQEKEKINEDDLDLIIIKGAAPEPIPAVVVAPAPIPAVVVAPTPVKKTVPKPVFLKRKNRGECGVEGNIIAFPLLHMGCCEDPRGLVMTVSIPIPKKIDKKFLSGFADIVKKYPFFDWSGESFQRNIIRPNREHIQMVMGLDDFIWKRVSEDLHVVINCWNGDPADDDDEEYANGEVKISHETFFTDRKCSY